jgi:predicted ArsR family transcriptional regulator
LPFVPDLGDNGVVKNGQQMIAEDRRTRTRVARLLLEVGPLTASDLAERLGLTATAVRRHLDALVDEGWVQAREPRAQGPRGRGRPAKTFALTDDGRGHFYQAYDDLATSALRFLAAAAGEQAIEQFARARVGEFERRYRALVEAAPPERRAEALAAALSADGYAASTAPTRAGAQLCQHHCPVAHVAEQFPQLCDAETEVFARLLGTHVQRLATIAHGDGVCTTHVPLTMTTTRDSGRSTP